MSDYTKSTALEAVLALPTEEQIRWMMSLGHNLTIAARNFYEVGTDTAEGKPLRGFNEIQHRVYGRILGLRSGEAWTAEDFLTMLSGYWAHFDIEREVRWALNQSLSFIAQRKTE